jgi:hypothetical protein
MRGYLSFVIVLISSLLLLSLIPLLSQARSADLGPAVAIERAYGLEMNAKECAIEAIRQGAARGFDDYNASHDLGNCSHCEDHFCVPPTPADPLPPNRCDALLCSNCFREQDARSAAANGALAGLILLRANRFEGDYNVSFGDAFPDDLDVFLAPDAFARNKLRVGGTRLREDLAIRVQSDKLGVSLKSRLPKGMVIGYGSDDG